MFASFSMPSKASVKSAAITTGKYVTYTLAAAGAIYGGVVLAKRYGGSIANTVGDIAGEQVVGG